ncbi:MAG: 7-carboxy-7-deazaguanine synthase QueE [Gammaproteobacteria bacterium]|nr:7-carboxy-7-deazaguanine synthase QueE [Gammaproteobacteria bacterium]
MGAVRITEIFHSIQGEANTVGWPTTFVRLTGCPLRCQYCDTAYAFTGGEMRSLDEVVTEVRRFAARHVTVTGGEPLAQPDVLPLLTMLCDADFEVGLETSGALDVSAVDERVSRVVDFKTPGSGEVHRNLFANVTHLGAHDQVKFVICDEADYEWAKFKCDEYRLYGRVANVLFAPSTSELPAGELADWILRDGLNVRLQVQMHKVLWGDVPGR